MEGEYLDNIVGVGRSVPRIEAFEKVTGTAKYNDDAVIPGILHVKMLTSSCAHAKIKSIDISKAAVYPGVKAVITGDTCPVLCGSIIEDQPPIARGKVRYYGEPVAVVVANSEKAAMQAVKLINVTYDELPVVNSISDALKSGAVLVHENMQDYKLTVNDVYPEPNTNVTGLVKIRKGDMAKGWNESKVVINASYKMPQADHIAMETRNVRAQILPSGQVIIYTSSQSPFEVKKLINKHFNVPEGNVTVIVPFVGGAFGGKAPVQLEYIAYMASKAVDGKMVRISNTREEDIRTSPCKLGAEAVIKLGAANDGKIKALDITYMIDCGAYADTGPRMAKAAAASCAGAYNIENIKCDSLCIYTNHTYATSYRGFGHIISTFCIERTLDKLADALKMDPMELRVKNALLPGNLNATQAYVTKSNTGDIIKCITKLKELTAWDTNTIVKSDGSKIKAKGISCFIKGPSSPTDAVSGCILTFNTDGSINVNFGAVECGPGMKTTIAQIIAEKMRTSVDKIHVMMDVNTRISPKHWKTVASMTTFMAGSAAIRAADNLIKQLIDLAAVAMRCPPSDLELGDEKVYMKDNPDICISFKDLVHGYKYTNGNSIEGQILGHGSYIMRHLTELDRETGKGKAAPSWTVGAQAVEVEYDPKEYTYRILKTYTVIDGGKVINPKTSRGVVMGGINMGLGLATREEFIYDNKGILETTSLRTYKVIRLGENPEYVIDFIETPQIDAPFGARGFGEHGILGIPSAVANALSLASKTQFDQVPITPEVIWRAKTGGKYDTI
jgi:CO/xanthine dehydrogenase Mo-binding subunit